MQQIQNLEPWARRTLGTGLGTGLAKTIMSSQDGFRHAVREGGELAILGGFTGYLFPYIVNGVRTVYNNTYEAFRTPQTLGTVSRSVTRNWNLLRTTTSGYLVETIYSLVNTPQIGEINDFRNHLVTHGWRGAVIGLGISSLPLVAYGVRRQIVERAYNFGRTRGWW